MHIMHTFRFYDLISSYAGLKFIVRGEACSLDPEKNRPGGKPQNLSLVLSNISEEQGPAKY